MTILARFFIPDSRGRPRRPIAAAPRPPLPSIGGAIFQTSGATMRTPGIPRRVLAISEGRSLKTGLGEFSREDQQPLHRAERAAHQVADPREMLNSPRNARIGIVSPTTARAVRDGRVIRFCQAKLHMTEIPE